jgi:hypothetical protein
MGEKLGSQSTAGDGGQFSRRTEVAIRGALPSFGVIPQCESAGLSRVKGQVLTLAPKQSPSRPAFLDANVVERDVPFSVDVLAARLRFLLGLGDEFGIFPTEKDLDLIFEQDENFQALPSFGVIPQCESAGLSCASFLALATSSESSGSV